MQTLKPANNWQRVMVANGPQVFITRI